MQNWFFADIVNPKSINITAIQTAPATGFSAQADRSGSTQVDPGPSERFIEGPSSWKFLGMLQQQFYVNPCGERG